MDRRTAIIQAAGKLAGFATSVLLAGCAYLPLNRSRRSDTAQNDRLKKPKAPRRKKQARRRDSSKIVTSEPVMRDQVVQAQPASEDLRTRLHKSRYFDVPHIDDQFVDRHQQSTLLSIVSKLKAIQDYVGHGRFNIVTIDDALTYTRKSIRLQSFSREELAFIEDIFSRDARVYGFFGNKVTPQLTDIIPATSIYKVPYTGHYLFKDQFHSIYKRMRKDVGRSLVLTSGVRGIVKQLYLFLAKTASVKGNLSQASRSLAPPGYSFHAIGDFDVGKRGLGSLNFTDHFSQTDEFKRLMDLGYIDIRYPSDNPFGVRYEPWHIEGFRRDGPGCSHCG